MPPRTGARRAALAGLLLAASACFAAGGQRPPLGAGETVAPGVELFTTRDQTLVEGAGPIAVFLLRLDPARVRLASALAHDQVMGAETVAGMAARHGAVAAINGGFFNVRNGEPVGVLKVAGALVSDSGVPKGAVLIRAPPTGATSLTFDRVTVRLSIRFTAGGAARVAAVDGVDTTRARGRLMLYTPRYHPDTDTAQQGIEWILSGAPLTVREVRRDSGHTPIPPDGIVLSFGGLDPPEPLAALEPGTVVTVETAWTAFHGATREALDRADAVVGGAGLLRVHGRPAAEWDAEQLNRQNFVDARHPRTLIGVDANGFIWLAAVDGRQPQHSIGMSFADLERLCDRLGLTGALNLDGGGSTSMVVRDRVVNRPSDATGPRPVSDAILVTLR